MPSLIRLSRVAIVMGLGSSLGLVGCGIVPAGSNSALTGPALRGRVHGGQQPVVGSQVDFLVTGAGGYGHGAVSLLTGGTVATDASGNFSITGLYTCPSSSAQVYMTATGGNPGSGVNNHLVMMSALGSCGNLTSSTFVNINEVATVASAFALAQFMLPGSTSVGTSSTNATGLLNAFSTVANLADLSTGNSLAVTPSGNGAVPQSKINTLADILAGCINSTGGAPCSALFAAATPPGGTAPTDTLSAILDIALNPGNNVQTIFNLGTSISPFQPTLGTSPNDWTLSVAYTGSGLNAPLLLAIDGAGNIWVPNGGNGSYTTTPSPGTLSMFSPVGVETTITGGGLNYPVGVAIDTSGNVWTANARNSVSEHTSTGSPLSGSSGYTAVGMSIPEAIAIDAAGNVYVADGNNSVDKLSSTGSLLAQFKNGGLGNPYGVAVDPSQNVWTANSAGDSVSKFSNTGVSASTSGFVGGGLSRPYWIAIDANGNAWTANYNSPSVTEMDSSGNPLSGAGYTTPSGVTSLAIDGNNSVWTSNLDGSISHLTSSGAAISPATGYTAVGATSAAGIVVDASGNVWATDNAANSLVQYVGAGAPTVVPLQLAITNNTLGQKP